MSGPIGQKEKKENNERDSNSGCLDSQTVSLTTCPWEHEATGLTAHNKHTYIHVLSYGGPKKMTTIPELFVLLWEKTGELSDGCFNSSSSLGTRQV